MSLSSVSNEVSKTLHAGDFNILAIYTNPSSRLPSSFRWPLGELLTEFRRDVTLDVTRDVTLDATFDAIFETCRVTAFCICFVGAATLLVIVDNLPTILAFRHLRKARNLLCWHGTGPTQSVLLFGQKCYARGLKILLLRH